MTKYLKTNRPHDRNSKAKKEKRRKREKRAQKRRVRWTLFPASSLVEMDLSMGPPMN